MITNETFGQKVQNFLGNDFQDEFKTRIEAIPKPQPKFDFDKVEKEGIPINTTLDYLQQKPEIVGFDIAKARQTGVPDEKIYEHIKYMPIRDYERKIAKEAVKFKQEVKPLILKIPNLSERDRKLRELMQVGKDLVSAPTPDDKLNDFVIGITKPIYGAVRTMTDIVETVAGETQFGKFLDYNIQELNKNLRDKDFFSVGSGGEALVGLLTAPLLPELLAASSSKLGVSSEVLSGKLVSGFLGAVSGYSGARANGLTKEDSLKYGATVGAGIGVAGAVIANKVANLKAKNKAKDVDFNKVNKDLQEQLGIDDDTADRLAEVYSKEMGIPLNEVTKTEALVMSSSDKLKSYFNAIIEDPKKEGMLRDFLSARKKQLIDDIQDITERQGFVNSTDSLKNVANKIADLKSHLDLSFETFKKQARDIDAEKALNIIDSKDINYDMLGDNALYEEIRHLRNEPTLSNLIEVHKMLNFVSNKAKSGIVQKNLQNIKEEVSKFIDLQLKGHEIQGQPADAVWKNINSQYSKLLEFQNTAIGKLFNENFTFGKKAINTRKVMFYPPKGANEIRQNLIEEELKTAKKASAKDIEPLQKKVKDLENQIKKSKDLEEQKMLRDKKEKLKNLIEQKQKQYQNRQIYLENVNKEIVKEVEQEVGKLSPFYTDRTHYTLYKENPEKVLEKLRLLNFDISDMTKLSHLIGEKTAEQFEVAILKSAIKKNGKFSWNAVASLLNKKGFITPAGKKFQEIVNTYDKLYKIDDVIKASIAQIDRDIGVRSTLTALIKAHLIGKLIVPVLKHLPFFGGKKANIRITEAIEYLIEHPNTIKASDIIELSQNNSGIFNQQAVHSLITQMIRDEYSEGVYNSIIKGKDNYSIFKEFSLETPDSYMMPQRTELDKIFQKFEDKYKNLTYEEFQNQIERDATLIHSMPGIDRVYNPKTIRDQLQAYLLRDKNSLGIVGSNISLNKLRRVLPKEDRHLPINELKKKIESNNQDYYDKYGAWVDFEGNLRWNKLKPKKDSVEFEPRLVGEGIEGGYNPETNKILVTDDPEQAVSKPTINHEGTHQYRKDLDKGKYIDETEKELGKSKEQDARIYSNQLSEIEARLSEIPNSQNPVDYIIDNYIKQGKPVYKGTEQLYFSPKFGVTWDALGKENSNIFIKRYIEATNKNPRVAVDKVLFSYLFGENFLAYNLSSEFNKNVNDYIPTPINEPSSTNMKETSSVQPQQQSKPQLVEPKVRYEDYIDEAPFKKTSHYVKSYIAHQEVDVDDLKQEIINRIKSEENFKPRMYPDYKSYSIGYGHYLKTPAEVMKYRGRRITRQEALQLLEQDYKQAYRDAKKFVPNLELLPKQAIAAVVDMSYNMGLSKLLTFKQFRKALNEGNLKKAALEVYYSKYYHTHTKRATRNIKKLIKAYYIQQNMRKI